MSDVNVNGARPLAFGAFPLVYFAHGFAHHTVRHLAREKQESAVAAAAIVTKPQLAFTLASKNYA